MSSVSSISGLTGKTSSASSTTDLGKDQFLKLLVTQLKYQDPLSPMKNEEFVAQLAQFSTLESMKNMENSFQGATAYGLIGKAVVTTDKTTGLETQGIVSGIKSKDGTFYVILPVKSEYVKKSDALQAFNTANLNFDQFKDKLFTKDSLSSEKLIWKDTVTTSADFTSALGYTDASKVPTSLQNLWDGSFYKEIPIANITQVYNTSSSTTN
jgi:flagellar basal-body rod modification protein FlgD